MFCQVAPFFTVPAKVWVALVLTGNDGLESLVTLTCTCALVRVVPRLFSTLTYTLKVLFTFATRNSG